jgi:predicted GH43/DUF377 family glycosyl hydrolase
MLLTALAFVSTALEHEVYARSSGKNTDNGSGKSNYKRPSILMFQQFKRECEGPVLSPRHGKFDCVGAFNPTVVKKRNGHLVMLYRGQDDKGISRIGYAESKDGIHFTPSDDPVLAPSRDDERNGIEDPRLSPSLSEKGAWDLTATIYNTDAQLALFRSKDLRHWKRITIMMPAKRGTWNVNWTKSGAIVPKKIKGKYWMYYMGDAKNVTDQTGVAWSRDGINWQDATDAPVLRRRAGKFDSKVVEPGPAPIVTGDGILLLYNGGDDALTYRTGWALFDRKNPARLLARSDSPVFEPHEDWEKKTTSSTVHQAPNVVFVEGLVRDGKRYLVYYGAADCRVGVASCVLKSVPGK